MQAIGIQQLSGPSSSRLLRALGLAGCLALTFALGSCKSTSTGPTDTVTPPTENVTIRRMKVGDTFQYHYISSTMGAHDYGAVVKTTNTTVDSRDSATLLVYDSIGSTSNSHAVRYEANGDVSILDFTGPWRLLPIHTHDSTTSIYGTNNADTTWNRYVGWDTITVGTERIACQVSQRLTHSAEVDSKHVTTWGNYDSKWWFAPTLGTYVYRSDRWEETTSNGGHSLLSYTSTLIGYKLK